MNIQELQKLVKSQSSLSNIIDIVTNDWNVLKGHDIYLVSGLVISFYHGGDGGIITGGMFITPKERKFVTDMVKDVRTVFHNVGLTLVDCDHGPDGTIHAQFRFALKDFPLLKVPASMDDAKQ